MLKEALKKKPYRFALQGLWSGSPSQKALKLSLALHLGVIGISLSLGLIQELRAWFKPKQGPLHIFSLESLPTGDTLGLAHSPPLESQPASRPLSQKTISKKKLRASIQFQPLPKPKTVPLVPAKTPQQVASSTKPKPAEPAKAKNLPQLSYEEFLKSQAKPPPAGASVKSHSLDPAKLTQALQSSALSQAQALNAGKGDALGTYINQMKAVIDTVWNKPSGLKGGIEALVEFEVDTQGTVTRYTLLKRSHHDLFDASIEAAFQLGLVLPPPPAGRQVFQLLFKSLDG